MRWLNLSAFLLCLFLGLREQANNPLLLMWLSGANAAISVGLFMQHAATRDK